MRIGIVNDMNLAMEALRRALAAAPQHQIAWTAVNGAEAVRRCAEDRPDIILMDLAMPVMDGVEATRRIMAATPCAIVVVTATVDGSASHVFEALSAGAIDAVNTPTLAGAQAADGARALLAKIESVGRLVDSRRGASPRPHPEPRRSGALPWLFAIGTSAGGPAALVEVLKVFPSKTPAAFVVVPHVDQYFASGLCDWLGRQISLRVRLVQGGESPESGVVLLPAREDHLVLRADGTLGYTPEPVNYVYRPSVDSFFESVVAHWHGPAAGILLTGMGRDGARGLKTMRTARFFTIAQDRATSAVYGMPKAAAELDAADRILPLPRIGPALAELLGNVRATA